MARGSMMDDMPPAGGDAAPVGVEADADETGNDAEDMAFADFADAAGIPEEKRDVAKDALADFVRACMSKDEGGGYGES